jgi:hypothetical protein
MEETKNNLILVEGDKSFLKLKDCNGRFQRKITKTMAKS